ncbi:hypothetical protein EDB83DRAFT_2322881 [Lactarius deliciosus]|nr:hypothetical protein EDB83DRAFT_2322875 [Lactarius deliciosus]KAH9008925.1 hypothetical protein EDB83DRAFT_2322881 [Lactarius deliciosus]
MGTQAQSVPVARTLSAGFVVENLASNLVLPMQRTLVQDYGLPLPEHRLGHVSPFPVLSGAVECMSAQWEAAMSRTSRLVCCGGRSLMMAMDNAPLATLKHAHERSATVHNSTDEEPDWHVVLLNDLLAAIDNEGVMTEEGICQMLVRPTGGEPHIRTALTLALTDLTIPLPSKLWERRLGMYTPSIILAWRQTPWKSHELTITTHFHGYVSAAPTTGIAAWVRQGGSFCCVRPALVAVTSLVLFDPGPALRLSRTTARAACEAVQTMRVSVLGRPGKETFACRQPQRERLRGLATAHKDRAADVAVVAGLCANFCVTPVFV